MSYFKKFIIGFFIIISVGFIFSAAPSFDNNFAKYLTDNTPDEYGRVETVFNLCIDRDISFMQNIKNLFYPSVFLESSKCNETHGGQLWGVIKVIMGALVFLFIVMAGVKLITSADKADETKKATMSLIYITYGAFLVFGVIWILGSVFNIPNLQGATELVQKIESGLFLQILTFLKVLAFFIAIFMMVVYGFQIMAAMDKSDKVKVAQKGIVNIIIALVLIKIIDYVFYIAQTPDFGQKAGDLIINIARVLGFIIGAAFVFAIFYAGFLLLTSSGKEETFKKAKGLIVNILLVSMVVFLFLLIVFQIFKEFA